MVWGADKGMIYIIIGPSHAGKTSFTVNSFLKGEAKYYKDLVGITECDSAFLIGNYLLDKRARGSDTIARQEVSRIPEQILRLVNRGKDIVLEGDKVCSKAVMKAVLSCKERCKLYYIRCSLHTSIERNAQFNSTVSVSVLKRVATKASNIYADFYSLCDGEIIDTDTITNFSKLSNKSDEGIRSSGLVVTGKLI